MHVLNRFSPLRFAGQNVSQPASAEPAEDLDYSEIVLPDSQAAHRVLMDSLRHKEPAEAGDCFDGSGKQGQIQLPLDASEQQTLMDTLKLGKHDRHVQIQHHQIQAVQRMHDDLHKKIAEQEKHYTQQLQKMALMAFHHSLLTEQNNMLLYGAVKNDHWNKEYGKLKHPPEQAQGLELEKLLHTEASTWDTLGFDYKVHNLYTGTMGHLADKKPAGLKLMPMSEKARMIYHRNEKTQGQLERDMEKFRHETLNPLQAELRKTQTEAEYFQDLLAPKTPVSESSAPTKPLDR